MDVKLAFRQFFKNPGFALVAVLTLALGIGGNTCIFSFINSWILRPAPFPDPDRLVVLFETDKRTRANGSTAIADWNDWRQKADIFQDLAAANWVSVNLTGIEEPEKIDGFRISANFFRTLGVRPFLGREFTEEEQAADEPGVVILSHELWRDRFSSDPSVIGRRIRLEDAPVTIVGVMPDDFQYIPMGRADLFIPLRLSPDTLAIREKPVLRPLARLKPGVDVARAQAALATLQASLENAYPATNKNRGVLVRSLQDEIDRQAGNDAVRLVFTIVSCVLLMACANVANLIMARSTGRRKEMAVRLAIGAGRSQLIRQLLGETLVLFLAGAGAGLVLARWGVMFLLHAIPNRSLAYIPNHGRVDLDWQVLLFTFLIALASGLAFGLAPALEATRFDLNTVLKDSGGRGTPGRSGGRVRKTLVAVEMAMAVIVVVCGALLTNSFIRMMSVDPGFRGDRVLVAEMQLPPKYKTPASIFQFYGELLERLSGIGGVERAAAAQFTPLSDKGNTGPIVVEGHLAPPPGQVPWARINRVTPGFLESMSIPLLSGRTVGRQDSATALPVVVINETFANRSFPGENPLGKRVAFDTRNPVFHTVIGVVKEIKYYDLTAPPESQAYVPFAQWTRRDMNVIARTRGDAAMIAQSIRGVVRSIDPNQPVSRIVPIATLVEERFSGDRLLMEIGGFFGTLALFLAAIGIYGVMAYSVSQRTQEIGVRMALGARSGDVLALIVRQGMGMILGGMIAGTAGAVVMGKLLSQFLYGVQPTDPLTFALAFFVLGATALLACAIPARRAARVDPLVALRYE